MRGAAGGRHAPAAAKPRLYILLCDACRCFYIYILQCNKTWSLFQGLEKKLPSASHVSVSTAIADTRTNRRTWFRVSSPGQYFGAQYDGSPLGVVGGGIVYCWACALRVDLCRLVLQQNCRQSKYHSGDNLVDGHADRCPRRL